MSAIVNIGPIRLVLIPCVNQTKYFMKEPKNQIVKVFNEKPLCSRKIMAKNIKSDVFVSKNIEPETLTNIKEPKSKKVKSYFGTGRKQFKEALAKYFDTDNPKNDYLIDVAQEEQKILEQNKAYRYVENAENIREFVEKARNLL